MEEPNSKSARPLLIYDGDCGFCGYWARYWQRLTGEQVTYKPYQEIASEYPDIPREAFQKAVQYIAPDGTRASAAKASFLTLSHAPGRSFWLALYRKLPGFSFIAEKTYAFIAAHRSIFYKMSLLLWGRDFAPPRYELLAWWFLRIFGLICLAAFISFGVQALGLVGSQGIVPVADYLTAIRNHFGIERYWLFPMIFWLNSGDSFIQITCWSGALVSLLLVFNILPRLSLLMIYVLYLSLFYAGQDFMTFQWDLFLLETAVTAIFLCGPLMMGVWLLRWLLFRFMFMGGMVKYFSGDSTWHDFSALSYYFMTQPLPSPLAWYVDHLPQSFLSFSTGATLMVELIVPFFIFLPRHIRFFAAYIFLIFQIIIILTGSYNFFNLLTILLCLMLFDDAALRRWLPSRLSTYAVRQSTSKILYFFASIFAFFAIFSSVVQFEQRFGFDVSPLSTTINNSITPLHIINTYGPFAVMTTKRKEIIIEGSDDGIYWSEYHFKYKPGDTKRPPVWNIPHQPRLDWQMWFAALGTPAQNPWFLHLLQRLLENSPAVLALFEDNPFPNKPPLYVRAQFFDYDFTNSKEKIQTGAWWSRQLEGLYYPAVNLIRPIE
jgi:predicted DCC family thiol-disulfide oxidoreductase YuxK